MRSPSGTTARSKRAVAWLVVTVVCVALVGCNSNTDPAPTAAPLQVGTVQQAACAAGTCTIAAACYANGAPNPANACQYCNTALTAIAWSNRAAGYVCRAAVAGGCDVQEVCAGGGVACPVDTVKAVGTVCRAAVAGGCDIQETCTGASNACPADAFVAAGTVCRAAVPGGCDIAESCTGASNTCPADAVMASGTVCRAAVAGGCDIAETCNGVANTCPADSVKAAGTVCPDDGNVCTTDKCNGTVGAPACVHAAGNAGTTCRAAATTCDIAETCTGASTTCPADALKANGTACTGGLCETGACCTTGCGTNSSGSCTALASESLTVCGAAGAVCASCDDSNICTSDACGATGACTHTTPTGCANGLTGNYYNWAAGWTVSTTAATAALAGTANLTRTDSTVNFNWGGSPGAPIGSTAFSVRWTGEVLADTTGTYTFSAAGDDGVNLWINGVLLTTGSWKDEGLTTYSGTIALTANRRYDVKFEYYQNGGGDAATLSWKPPGAASSVVIPSDHLFPGASACTVCPTGNECTVKGCSAAAGVCGAAANLPDGTACTGGTCASGNCCTGCLNGSSCVSLGGESATQCGAAGAACGTCDDGNPCTTDACTGAGACTHTPLADGTTCRAAAGACDVAETCSAGVCPADAFASFMTACLDDGQACTDDYCSGISVTCTHPTKLTCQTGLMVTYYDNIDFTGPSVDRVDPNINNNWGNGSPDPTIGVDTFSARWTGQVKADFSETYTFETESDDGIRLWVNDVLLVDDFRDQGPTKTSGTITLVAGSWNDIKVDYYEDGGGAEANLRWSSPSTPYAIIPQDHLKPTGDKGTGGMAWLTGADNGTGDPYQIWRTSTTPGVAPVNATPESPNNWGLGNAVMMVPNFSPDGKKLVFIDGDSAGGAGWRKGLSMWDFDQTGKTFSNRQSIRNTWPSGDVMKWPVWESDSRTIIFQTSTPTDLCSTCSTLYGNMAPTNYYGIQGLLWSIDSAGGASAVQLTNLNTGERPADANKSYQPTVLPIAVGGYRWTVFTSTRPYGNTLNPPGIDRSCTASQLWVAAIDDTTSASTDRSHPAFWLPNQNIGTPAQNSYINERGYWVKGPCKPSTSIGPESACLTNDDCCGAPLTAACRIDQPATIPPTRHCIPINPNVCVANGGSCGADADCCGFPTTHCISGLCQPPAPIPAYTPGSFTRDYFGNCPAGTSPVWRFFDWQAVTPSDSKIVFSVKSAPTSALLASATAVPLGVASGPATPGWVGENVGDALENNGQASQLYIRITMSIQPSTDHVSTPTLTQWRQAYSCLPSQ